MIKKILATSLFGLTLVMSGCGDTEGEDRLATQQMLDDGDFTGVISKLESIASSDDDYIALGAAYMGKAGLTLTNIVSSMVSATDTNDNAFAGFVTGISSTSSSTALTDLNKAVDYYNEVIKTKCADKDILLSTTQQDICLYKGLASTSSAAVTIDLIAGDISTFGDTDIEDYKLTASVCGMNYAFDRTQGDCTVTEQSDVNFTIINKVYTPLIITVNADTNTPKTEYHYLMNDVNQTVLTKDFCLVDDFTRYEDINATANLYACPINEVASSDELTTTTVLVDVLNDGIDSIGGVASDETQSDIDEFKCDILGGTYDGSDCNVSLDNNVTEEDVIDYLNSQN
jgi:hypothetical protein